MIANGDRCVCCGGLILAGEITYWQGDAKQPMHERCREEAELEHWLMSPDLPAEPEPAYSSRVVYRTEHLPQPCSLCINAGPGYSGWLHSSCAERHWRIVRLNELNSRRV